MSENRLGQETSPYLLQHKDNPVHWWAWGPEALAEAKRTGKPILLSVGYAACHWCHVMAHESFEDAATAARHERAVRQHQGRPRGAPRHRCHLHARAASLGEQGGWPLTMFLDSEARPFWGGTYFPPTPRYGRPGFADVLREVARVYREEPDKVAHNAGLLADALKDAHRPTAADIDERLLADLTGRMVAAVDRVHGGLSGAPKFPQWSFFWLLWRGAIRYGHDPARHAVETTLDNICQGGIYDHLGGGFARYSVDERWLVPHFEKMLYDNALLIDLICEVYREGGNELYARRIDETAMAAARDGRGGRRLRRLARRRLRRRGRQVLRLDQARDRRGAGRRRRARFAEVYDVSEAGNWEGHTILNRLRNLDPRSRRGEGAGPHARSSCWPARRRVRPGWDDKVLADWNGLMIAALAHAARCSTGPSGCGGREGLWFVRAHEDGRLVHSYRAGQAKAPATASDYANMIWGALRLCRPPTKPPSSPSPSAGAPCSTSTTGWPTAAATPSPPTTRRT